MTDTISIAPELASLMQSDVSISVATRDRNLMPGLMRVLGCRVDGNAVTLYLPGARAARTLADIADNGMVAAVFSQMSTHVTVQLKGRDARQVALVPGDLARVAHYCEIFLRKLESIGHTVDPISAITDYEPERLVAVRFTPFAAYTQTPGPQAGKPLGSDA